MAWTAIRPTVLNSGLLGNISCYQIKPTDRATPTASANGGIDVVNQAHTDINNIFIQLNAHHNASLQHIGNFEVNGDFYVNGNTTDFEVSAVDLADKLLYLNVSGNTITAESAGLTVGSSAGDISSLVYSASAGLWYANGNKIATFDYDLTLNVISSSASLSLASLADVSGATAQNNSSLITIVSASQANTESPTGTFIASFEKIQSILLQNSWVASGNSLNTARGSAGCCGASNGALIFGGAETGGNNIASTEIWNGSAWANAAGTLNVARRALGGVGTIYSALSFGGYSTSAEGTTEIYNSILDAWSLSNSLNQIRYQLAGTGTRNSALSIGGISGAATLANVERYDGASWSTATSLLTTNQASVACGTQRNARVSTGFDGSSYLSVDEIYNGVMNSWSAGATINQTRRYCGVAGTTNSALIFGGNSGGTYIPSTEKLLFNVWTIVGAINQIRQDLSGAGASNFALSVGGVSGISYFGTTEKFYGVANWELDMESTADGSYNQSNVLRYTSPTTLNTTVLAKESKDVYLDENELAELGRSTYKTDGVDNSLWPGTGIGNIISTRLFDSP